MQRGKRWAVGALAGGAGLEETRVLARASTASQGAGVGRRRARVVESQGSVAETRRLAGRSEGGARWHMRCEQTRCGGRGRQLAAGRGQNAGRGEASGGTFGGWMLSGNVCPKTQNPTAEAKA